jgi:hypothetical protein
MTANRDGVTPSKLSIALAACLLSMVVACGGGELTLGEYAEEVEALTTTMYAALDDLVYTFETASEADRDAGALYGGMAVAFAELLDGLEAIDPPAEVADLHDLSLDIMARLTAAQETFARRVEDSAEGGDPGLENTPEALALRAVQDEMIAFCQARQAEFDATADREVLAENPWIPAEMREVVDVLFGCGSPGEGGS